MKLPEIKQNILEQNYRYIQQIYKINIEKKMNWINLFVKPVY